jgi:3-methyladenine DNA glycosylase AlkD
MGSPSHPKTGRATMNVREVLSLIKENRNERGIAHWEKIGAGTGLKGYGIGLTQLRKMAKKVGRNHELALKLWVSDVYEARILGALIDEPKKMTREQAEKQVEELEAPMLTHTLAKTPFAKQLTVDWIDSDDDTRRRCGYLMLYELGKKKGKDYPDEFFEEYLERIQSTIHDEPNWIRDAMNGSMLSIGKRSINLHSKTLAAAEAIGRVDVDYGDNSCEAVDIVKHMNSDYLLKKLYG